MHKLRNGSQVDVRPDRKPTSGLAGYFSESNDQGAPSYPGQDWFNDCTDEFLNALEAAGITYTPGDLTLLAQAISKSSENLFIKHMLFKGMPMSAVGPEPDPAIWLPAGRVELLRADYPTVFEIVSASAFFTDQATIDADPRAYAGHWGDGDGATTFTTDDWALMMNIKVAGGYGAEGSTKEDHMQNITGSIRFVYSAIGSLFESNGLGGAFEPVSPNKGGFALSGLNVGPELDKATSANFNASRVARTDTYTDTMGLFLDHYRVIPKGVFSYA